jgi:hypothetical protein
MRLVILPLLALSFAAGAVQAQPAPATALSAKAAELQECMAVFGVTSAIAKSAKDETTQAKAQKLFNNAGLALLKEAGSDAVERSQDNAAKIVDRLSHGEGASVAREFADCAVKYPAA